MKNFKKTKPHQLFNQRVMYVSHLKRVENLMSDQSPNTKRNKRERINLISMMHSSRKIHQNSIRHEFSLRTQRQNEFLSNNFTHVKSVLKTISNSRIKNQTPALDTKKNRRQKSKQKMSNCMQNNSDPTINILKPTNFNGKFYINKGSLNTSPNKAKLLMKIRLQQQQIEQENQRLVNRLLRVRPQISFAATQRKQFKYKAKNKKHTLTFVKRSKQKNNLLDQERDVPNQSPSKQFQNEWKEALIKTDMLKIYQNTKLNYTITQKQKIVLKLCKNKQKLHKFNKTQKVVAQSLSRQQSNNNSIINNTQMSIGVTNNLKLKKTVLCFDQSFYAAAKISKFQRKQIYSIEVRFRQKYIQRTSPGVLEDIIKSEIILLLPQFKPGMIDKQNYAEPQENSLKLNFFKNLENKTIFKGSVTLNEKEIHSTLQQTCFSQKKKTCLTHRTNIPLLLGNLKTKNCHQFNKIQKQFLFPNGKRSIHNLNVQVRSQYIKQKARKRQTGVIHKSEQNSECE